MPEVTPGPVTKAEAVETLKEKLDDMSRGTYQNLKDMMKDRDLEALPQDQQEAIQELTLLRDLSMAAEARVRTWLLEDKGFQECFERRRIAGLRSYGFMVDDQLSKLAREGDPAMMRLYYQRTGTLPVGGEYARMPEEAKGDKDLAGLISSIVDKAMKAKEKK